MKFVLLFSLVVIYGCSSRLDQNSQDMPANGEQYRPQFHFTPADSWMNDPNGMVYYEGEYHLFYQFYPDSNVWGPMHWGHAVSKDLISWEHLPVALYPDSLGYIFSGSAVVDWNNSTGFGDEDTPPLVAIYTYHDAKGEKGGSIDYQTQGIAYSLDKGRTWTKYSKNPVLNNPGIKDFRDPKVFWDEDFQQWTMILAVKDHVEIYSSFNLIEWKLESQFGKRFGGHGGVWECPDLFPLVDRQKQTQWVMLVSINPGGPQGGSATQYFVGDFDGSVFTPNDSTIRWIDYGADNYAGVTWSDIPNMDGRRLFIGWMGNWQYAQVVPTYSWRSAMTIPRELLLKKTNAGYLVQSNPVVELDSYFSSNGKEFDSGDKVGTSAFKLTISRINKPMEISFENDLNEKLSILFDQDSISIDRRDSGDHSFSAEFGAIHSAPFDLKSIQSATFYMDNSSIELFINDGELVMTDLFFMSEPISVIKSNSSIDMRLFEYVEDSH